MVDIKGYEGLYAITSCGRVWSYRSKKFLKFCNNKNGYLIVRLSKDGVQKAYSVHRLVAEHYIPNPLNLPIVNHKDEVKTHNWINNLEWCTYHYNSNYGTAIQRQNESKYKKVMCVETGQIFNSQQEAAEWAGVKPSTLATYFLRNRKTCGGYTWKQLNCDPGETGEN